VRKSKKNSVIIIDWRHKRPEGTDYAGRVVLRSIKKMPPFAQDNEIMNEDDDDGRIDQEEVLQAENDTDNTTEDEEEEEDECRVCRGPAEEG
jgi:hypothetical protein